MIIRERPSIWKLFFVLKGSIVPQIAPQILGVFGLGLAVILASHFFPDLFTGLTAAPFALMGLALSIFLGFRNNACYDRWWEARKLWGQLVIDCRSLSRQIAAILDPESSEENADIQKIHFLLMAFVHALRHHLRQSAPWAEIGNLLSPQDLKELRNNRNLPDALIRKMSVQIAHLMHSGRISDIQYRILEERLTSLSGVQAACERIQSTPLPFAYSLLLHRTAYLYCLALPIGLVATLGWLTPIVAAVIAYTLFGLDALSEELEDPFGTSPHDLALGAISRSIEINLREAIGDSHIPDPSSPENYRLS